MNERAKRILMIFLFILSVCAIGFILYVMFFKPSAVTPTPTEQPTIPGAAGELTPSGESVPVTGGTPIPSETGALPEAAPVAAGGVTQTISLTTAPVTNITISSNGISVNYYNNEDGRFYTIDKDGNVVRLSGQQFPDVKNTTWNSSAEKAVLEFPDGSNIVYDFQNQKQVTLPPSWEDFSFSPTTNQIAAKSTALDSNNRWIVTASDNGSNVTPIQALGDNADRVNVKWSPNDQVVAFADTSDLIGESSGNLNSRVIYPIGKNHENFKGLQVQGFGFSPSWSPSGKELVYSVYGDYSFGKPLLWAVDATASTMGDHRRNLGLNTWADKCTWGADTVMYCAVPQNLPDNAGLQPSLYEDLPDSLYRVDTTSGQILLLAIPDQNQTMKNLSISEDQSLLYYTDMSTGQLKLIHLK